MASKIREEVGVLPRRKVETDHPSGDTSGDTARESLDLKAALEQHKVLAEVLENKLRLQRLLASISARFALLPSDRINGAIEDSQRIIGEALGIDRCTLWQIAEDNQQMVLTHCWQSAGLPPMPETLSAGEHFPWLLARVKRGDSLRLHNLDELPPEAARDSASFRTLGTKSSLTIPLFANGMVFGATAFATVREPRRWEEAETTEIKLLTEVFGNVLARKRAEDHADELRSEMAHGLRVATLGEIVSALAHDLNQPLAAILSNAQAARRFLSRGIVDTEELGAILDDIIRDDKRAGSVIHHLRAMLSKRPAVPESNCLNDLIREVIELLHGELLSEDVEVVAKLEKSLPRVRVARVELQQVIVNLLLNAEQAMKETPHKHRRIEIETAATEDGVSFAIRDHGCGIQAGQLTGIFDPFYTTKSHGLGMGLSICKRIIENHGGRIEAHNHRESGAVFSVFLPSAKA